MFDGDRIVSVRDFGVHMVYDGGVLAFPFLCPVSQRHQSSSPVVSCPVADVGWQDTRVGDWVPVDRFGEPVVQVGG